MSRAATDVAAQRKATAARRRREEAQLRLMWEQEVERGHVLQLRIAEHDRQLAALTRQYERQLEDQGAELHQAESDLQRWQRKLDATRRGKQDRLERLDELDREFAALESARDAARMQLIHAFVPRTASDLPIGAGSGGGGGAAADAVLDEFRRFFAEIDNEFAPRHLAADSVHSPGSGGAGGSSMEGTASANSNMSPNRRRKQQDRRGAGARSPAAARPRDFNLDPMLQTEVAAETRRTREAQTKGARTALEEAVAELRELTMGESMAASASTAAASRSGTMSRSQGNLPATHAKRSK